MGTRQLSGVATIYKGKIFMIDIHTHILPGVDDGARDVKEALTMARLAVQDGITHLLATPHYGLYQPMSHEEVAERVATLQAELDAARIDLTLLPGYEVRLDDDVFTAWDARTAGPLGQSRYVLTEPYFNHYDRRTDELLFEFFERGYIPIMAHPERIGPIQNNLSLIDAFLERGGLTQITSHSLTGYHGHKAKQVAQEMLQAGLVNIIASDAHHAYRRTPALAEGWQIAAKIVGESRAKAMVTTTPMAVVNDEPILTHLPATCN
jgi:protein-tyrosine phosphatase